MKIFSWILAKYNGKENNNPGSTSNHMIHQYCKEEVSDWLNPLLAIGTFGNNNLKDSEKLDDVVENEYDQLHQMVTTSTLVQGEEKDTNNNGIAKKSVSFLLKKALGFAPSSIFRDPVADTNKLGDHSSRINKIFRAMLQKQVYPQKSSSNVISRKYLDMPSESESDDEVNVEASHNESKWVKTDSEYIVLEI